MLCGSVCHIVPSFRQKSAELKRKDWRSCVKKRKPERRKLGRRKPAGLKRHGLASSSQLRRMSVSWLQRHWRTSVMRHKH